MARKDVWRSNVAASKLNLKNLGYLHLHAPFYLHLVQNVFIIISWIITWTQDCNLFREYWPVAVTEFLCFLEYELIVLFVCSKHFLYLQHNSMKTEQGADQCDTSTDSWRLEIKQAALREWLRGQRSKDKTEERRREERKGKENRR